MFLTPSNTSDRNNENLNRLLARISKKKYSHKCIVGDYNFKDINWLTWTTIHNEESKEAKFMSSGRGKSCEELWFTLKSQLWEMRNRFVPKRNVSTISWKEIGGFPINKELQEAIRNKRATHRNWMAKKNYGDPEIARLNYTKARNRVTKLMRQSKRKYESDIALKSKEHPKVFWSHIRSRLKTKTGISPLLEDVNDKKSTKFSNEEKANILQKGLRNRAENYRPISLTMYLEKCLQTIVDGGVVDSCASSKTNRKIGVIWSKRKKTKLDKGFPKRALTDRQGKKCRIIVSTRT